MRVEQEEPFENDTVTFFSDESWVEKAELNISASVIGHLFLTIIRFPKGKM